MRKPHRLVPRHCCLAHTRSYAAACGRRQQLPGPEQPPAAGGGRARCAGRARLWSVVCALYLRHAGTDLCLYHLLALQCLSRKDHCKLSRCVLPHGAGVVRGRMLTAGWRRNWPSGTIRRQPSSSLAASMPTPACLRCGMATRHGAPASQRGRHIEESLIISRLRVGHGFFKCQRCVVWRHRCCKGFVLSQRS